MNSWTRSLAVSLRELESLTTTEEAASELRRAAMVAMNGGVCLPALEKLKFRVESGDLEGLSTEQKLLFSKTLADDKNFDYKKAFKMPMKTFKRDLLQNSSDHCFTGLCWNPIFTIAFRNGLQVKHRNVKFRIVEKFNCSFLVSDPINYGVVIESLSGAQEDKIDQIPIFMIEPRNEFTKLCSSMASACIELAYSLIDKQRRPELACVYGLLVDGTKASLFRAQPAFKEIEGLLQVYAVISDETEWQIDILKEPEATIQNLSSRKSKFYETTVDATVSLPNFEDLYSVATVSQSACRTVIKDPIPFNGIIKEAALKKAVFISEKVKARISLLRHHAIYRLLHVQDFNPVERKITCEVDLFLVPFFPHLHRWYFDKQNANKINYRLEDMLPLFEEDVARKCYQLSCQFFPHNPVEFTLGYTKFFLDCSFNLFLLHSRAGIVHSDLSPRNIMYSQLNRMWKLIDYDRAMRIEDSLKTKRVAGTEGFIAPEALKTGIFTFESDIWSLGRLLFACFFGRTSSCYDKAKWLDAVLDKLRNLVFSMTLNDPVQRPALPLVIREVYGVIGKFAYGHLTHRGDLILDAVAKYVAIWDEEEANLHAKPTIAKRPKSSGQTI